MKPFAVGMLILALTAYANLRTDDSPPDDAKATKKEDPEKTKRKPNFTISKETTYVTGPVDKDGYIDYVTALNERMRQGVTPENNANVLLWKAMGPEGSAIPAEYFKWLGIEPPPKAGDYFIPFDKYLKDHLKIDSKERIEELEEVLTRSYRRASSAQPQQEIVAWLKANEKPLALVVEATRRPRYFSPILPTRKDKGLGDGPSLPNVYKTRDFAKALAVRAIFKVHNADVNGAWDDLLACRRLGRHVVSGGTIIEGLVGIALDGIASSASLAFLDQANLDATQLKRCLNDLQAVPPVPDMADKISLAERFIYLDTVMMLAAGRINLKGRDDDKETTDALAKLLTPNTDWDPALRGGNRMYDRLAAALRIKDRKKREEEIDKIEKELGDLKERLSDPCNLGKVVAKPDGSVGERIANALITLMLPAGLKMQQAADRAEQTHRNLWLAFALAAYRRDNRRYPDKLEALVPKYLADVPLDVFSGKEPLYRLADKGYLLYSVGVNGQDDDGRGIDDDPAGDDLVVRMPLPPLPKKEKE